MLKVLKARPLGHRVALSAIDKMYISRGQSIAGVITELKARVEFEPEVVVFEQKP
jgi:hypothetical protein